MRRTSLYCVLCVVLLAFVRVPECSAQFRLVLNPPIQTSYPTIRIPLQVLDNSALIKNLQPGNFTVLENGVSQSPLFLDCETDSVASEINFLFVVDVSTSMRYIEGTTRYDRDSVKWKKAKNVLIESFHKLRPNDEAALITFAATTVLNQTFTKNKKLLEDAVAGLSLNSGTAIYDAILFALNQAEWKPGKTVIILLTDGSDQSSKNNYAQAIVEARRVGIPVYTIGLDVKPEDETILKLIAKSTGGEYFLAPTSEQLSEIYNKIINSIFSSRCILTYTTSDTCRRGGRRHVEVTVNVSGGAATTEYAYYDVPDFRSKVNIGVVDPGPIPDNADFLLPVSVAGEIRNGENATFDMLFRFDPSCFVFKDIQVTGTVLDGQGITVTEIAPGEFRITGNNVAVMRQVNYGTSDVLFYIRVHVNYFPAFKDTETEIVVTSFNQNCPGIPTGFRTNLLIQGCPLSLHMSHGDIPVARSGSTFSIPVILHDSIDIRQNVSYSFRVSYDHTMIIYQGLESENTISESMPLSVLETAPGTLLITALDGVPKRNSGVLLYLIFQASERLESHIVPFKLEEISLQQICTPAISYEGDHIYLSGVCEPVIKRKNRFELKQNIPNPISISNAAVTSIEFSVLGLDRARLEVFDITGKSVGVLVDANLAPGIYFIQFAPQNLPTGAYIYTLTEGKNTYSRRMILTR